MSARLPVVVVGAGVAGLATALAAAPAPVVLVCRGRGGAGSASELAQGGIAAALGEGDSASAHARDTCETGAWHNAPAMVDWLCARAPATVAWLAGQGVAFDRDDGGRLLLGREGGHHAARIVHAGGDATGAALVRALVARAREAAHIEWREGCDAHALLLGPGRVCGVRTRDVHGGETDIPASAVVLATGGPGALYARTSNPPAADGSGLALALAAGARLRDLEFVQFHPTALDVEGHSLPLLTEALRGAGAVLLDQAGRRLMAGVHPLADLAPRDVVARAVQAARRHGPAWLDARGIAEIERRFPTVTAACRARGFDPRLQPLPVTPAAHFHMGGVAVDASGASSLPGLHAVGEIACSGVHGANRLASNSLLEGVACGRALGARLARSAAPPAPAGAWRAVPRGASLSAPALEDLRALLWRELGPVRDGAGLRRARRACAALGPLGWQARLATAMVEAALQREHGLGAHFRSDEPTMRRRMAAEA